jgi:hypothetical protein
MEEIKVFLPLIGVVIGFLLSEGGKIFSSKRQDKRKLKKLLYYMLELRYHFAWEIFFEAEIDKYWIVLKYKIAQRSGVAQNDPEFTEVITSYKPTFVGLISKMNKHDDKINSLSQNIDEVVTELAEIFPVMAYEISGEYNIKQRLEMAQEYLNELQRVTDERLDFHFEDYFNSKVTSKLVANLDDYIHQISKMIDRKTARSSKDKISNTIFEANATEVEKLIDEYLDKVISQIS